MTIRTYSELKLIETHLDRYKYLALNGEVGCATFGHNRWINQQFYTSKAWRLIRRDVIARDLGCDLGVEGYEIHSKIIIHHMNPLTQEDIMHGTHNALDPEGMICVTHDTHNAIHYGDETLLRRPYIARRPNDTKLW